MNAKLKDFMIFAVIMFGAGLVATFVTPLIPSLAALGIAGTALMYAIGIAPAYLLLRKFWKRKS